MKVVAKSAARRSPVEERSAERKDAMQEKGFCLGQSGLLCEQLQQKMDRAFPSVGNVQE
jgi:hypothetical protein